MRDIDDVWNNVTAGLSIRVFSGDCEPATVPGGVGNYCREKLKEKRRAK